MRNNDGDFYRFMLAAVAVLTVTDGPFILASWLITRFNLAPKHCSAESKELITRTLCHVVRACNGVFSPLRSDEDGHHYCGFGRTRGNYAHPRSEFPVVTNATGICPSSTIANSRATGDEGCCDHPGEYYPTAPYDYTSSPYGDCTHAMEMKSLWVGALIGVGFWVTLFLVYTFRDEISSAISTCIGRINSRVRLVSSVFNKLSQPLLRNDSLSHTEGSQFGRPPAAVPSDSQDYVTRLSEVVVTPAPGQPEPSAPSKPAISQLSN